MLVFRKKEIVPNLSSNRRDKLDFANLNRSTKGMNRKREKIQARNNKESTQFPVSDHAQSTEQPINFISLFHGIPFHSVLQDGTYIYVIQRRQTINTNIRYKCKSRNVFSIIFKGMWGKTLQLRNS